MYTRAAVVALYGEVDDPLSELLALARLQVVEDKFKPLRLLVVGGQLADEVADVVRAPNDAHRNEESVQVLYLKPTRALCLFEIGFPSLNSLHVRSWYTPT